MSLLQIRLEEIPPTQFEGKLYPYRGVQSVITDYLL
jgi:hypothetical protein